MVFKFASWLLQFLCAALESEARRSAASANECQDDIGAVEAQRIALVQQANERAEAVTQELARTRAEHSKASAKAAALAANLGLLTSLDQE